jgi:hypothetical protein
MGFVFDYTPATTPIYACGAGAYTNPAVSVPAVAASGVVATTIQNTVFEYKKAYEATSGKTYQFKTQEERMRYMLEAMKTANCPPS